MRRSAPARHGRRRGRRHAPARGTSTRTHALSRFLVAELLRPHYFDLTAARRALGFAPPIGFDAGIAELTRSRSARDDSGETPF
ncbi:hypothetical protein FM21_15895 [Streptomyces mutabilis]|uniref:Uncharacterized protein n=1 Tax=Streptomyces mutabilis TaxID=67332 RepID=A0A086N8H5_9ACTN|nr:hypothetical protein FM21_15895 [Streptomyces mutabilis]